MAYGQIDWTICEDFEDHLYHYGLDAAREYILRLTDGDLDEHIEFNDMDIDSVPGGGIELTFTKSGDFGEDYVTFNTDRIKLESDNGKIAWFTARKNIHFGIYRPYVDDLLGECLYYQNKLLQMREAAK